MKLGRQGETDVEGIDGYCDACGSDGPIARISPPACFEPMGLCFSCLMSCAQLVGPSLVSWADVVRALLRDLTPEQRAQAVEGSEKR